MIKKTIIFILGIVIIIGQTYASSGSVITNGTGTTEEMICTTQFAPVCDKEGKIYSNSCMAGDREKSFDYCNKPISLGDEKATIQRAYDNNITKFNTVTSFQGSSLVTRAQAAKMVSTRGKLIYPELGQTTKLNCKFSDIKNQPSDLQAHITQSCKYGLFQGYQGRFMPTQHITKGQMLIVLKRIIGIKYANTQSRPEKVFSRQAFYETAGDSVNNSLDRITFITLLGHSYNILSDSLSFNSSIW